MGKGRSAKEKQELKVTLTAPVSVLCKGFEQYLLDLTCGGQFETRTLAVSSRTLLIACGCHL